MPAPLVAIVDNDAAFLVLMQEVLVMEGYRAVAWPGGDGAHALVKREQPALLILDLRMERFDEGITVLQLVRLDPATRATPIILCSADAAYLRENETRLRDQGCALLHKPFDLEELVALVGRLIGPAAEDSVLPPTS